MKKETPFALKVRSVTVHYHTVPVLWDINLEIPQGCMIGILGPNGAGKSTLIKAILGLISLASGTVLLKGKHVETMRKKISYVPQKEAVDWDFPITVRELVLMGRYPEVGMFRRIKRDDRAKASHYIEMVGMSEFEDRQISQLSGGQQQRAFLARALLQEADIYFLDEPLAGVDQVSEKIILNLLHKLRDEGKTIFMVHHDLTSVQRYFDWIVLLNIRLIASGHTKEVFIRENIEKAYGKGLNIFDETMRLSQNKVAGINA